MNVKLKHEIIDVAKLTENQIEQMFFLMEKYYSNISFERLINDLKEKKYVIWLQDEISGQLAGFSTIVWFPLSFQGDEFIIVFSGDTIIDRNYWGANRLPIVFMSLLMDLKKKSEEKKIIWMLISKGFRTYNYLPLFSFEFFPNAEKPTPEKTKNLMNYLGMFRFPDLYDPDTGIIVARSDSPYLKPEYQRSPKRKKGLHEIFFLTKNPGYEKGDELLCVVEISEQNIKPILLKAIKEM